MIEHTACPPPTTAGWVALVEEHIHLVETVLARVAYRYPRHVDRTELWNAGALGLVEAARRFDPAHGVSFARYASVRIKGAIIDATRTRDWVSRAVRRRLREMEDARLAFAAAQGRVPCQSELATILGITEREVEHRQHQAATSVVLYLDQTQRDEPGIADHLAVEDPYGSPDEALALREMVGTLREAVRELPGTHGEVIRRYYLDGELLHSIAADLGVTEARVSQIRSEGLEALRSFFGSLYDGVPTVSDDSPGKRLRAEYAAEMTKRSNWRSRVDSAGDAPLVASAG